MDSKIDRLIELGLNRYGAGDLDGAILMWEEALAIEPDNAKATSYLEYTRSHYELFANAEPAVTARDDDAFAINEEPEYQIEIQPGELVPSDTPPSLDAVDSGWFDELPELELVDLEKTASEPLTGFDDDLTLAPTIEAREPEPEPSGEISFEESTREYHSARMAGMPVLPPKPSDFSVESATTEFQAEETTGGFRSNEATDIRKRDLGFVRPAADEAQPKQSQADIATQDIPVLRDRVTKREMLEPRPPARRDSAELSQAEVMLTAAKTRSFDLDLNAPTRDLGLRPQVPQLADPPDEDLPTKQSDARAIRAAAASLDEDRPATRTDMVLSFDPIDARANEILSEVDAGASEQEPVDERTRRRIGALLERATQWSCNGEIDRAVAAVDLAMSEDPNSVLAQKLLTRNRDAIMTIFQGFIGDSTRQMQLTKPLHELQNAPISPRAAFLLSRIDGSLTIDELLDVSGMPRMEAYRYLCQLLLRGILR